MGLWVSICACLSGDDPNPAVDGSRSPTIRFPRNPSPTASIPPHKLNAYEKALRNTYVVRTSHPADRVFAKDSGVLRGTTSIDPKLKGNGG